MWEMNFRNLSLCTRWYPLWAGESPISERLGMRRNALWFDFGFGLGFGLGGAKLMQGAAAFAGQPSTATGEYALASSCLSLSSV